MGIQAHYLKDSDGNKFYPYAHANATFDENGVKVGKRLNDTDTQIEELKNKVNSSVQSVKIGDTEYKNGTSVVLPEYPTTLPADGGNATTVNGHTVNSDVPANAVFTDTVYTHPNSTVTPGTYKSVTVDGKGHITSGSNPTTLSGYGITDAALSSDLTSHINDTSNSHKVTKAQVGLGNVENKSSATIRSEITKTNVTNALGYTPYTPNEVDNKFAALETNIDWKESVDTFDNIATTYPNPVDGWTVNVKDTDYTYRYNGTSWVAISANAIPKATNSVDGLLSKEDHTNYEDANSKKHTHSNKSVIDGISSTNVSDWNSAKTHADSAHAPSNAQANVIETVKVNGTALTPSSKAVNVIVPTKVSELTNDSGFKTTDNNTTYELSKSGSTITLTGSDGSTTSVTDNNSITGVKGNAESSYRTGNVNITPANIGLGNVGNFKAVSTVASQGLTDTEKSNARANIGAGTSSFSGSYNDLTNKPTIPSVGNGTITITQNGATKGTFTTNQSGDTTIALTDNNTTYSDMTGATSSNAGAHGLVPAPASGAANRYLRSDGTWAVPPDTNTTYSSKSAVSGGTDVSLVTTGEKYTWNNKANASHGNHVPATQTANNAVFLRNDNTWQTVTPANIGAAASSHTHSAYVNQNAFSNVVVGSTTVAADSATDTLTLVAGSNVTITPDADNDKITIAATDTNTWRPLGTTADTACAGNDSRLSNSRPASDVYAWAKASTKPSYTWDEITSKPSTFTPATHTHNYIESKGNYTFTSETLPNSFDLGVSAGFVKDDSGFGSFGSVLTVRTYTGGGGSLQLYAPYASNFGGTHMKARFGNYGSSNGNSWTELKEVAWVSDIPTNYAGSSSAGGSATSAVKLDSSAGSATQPVYFSGGKPVACTYTLGKSVPSDAVFTDTNTHYASGTIVNNSATATANTSTALTNGNVFLNHIENGVVKNSHKISGSGATTVTTDASGNIIISSTDNNTVYTHPSYTARTGVPTANATPAFGGTFSVSQPVSDATGHVTAINSRTITIPSTLSNGSSTAGLIKTSSTVTSASGYTACPVISGVPYYKDTNTTYSAATTSAAGLMSAADKTKLDGITDSADSVSFSTSLTSGTKVGTITINGTGTDLYAPTNTDTHYTSHLYVGASGGNANATSATSNPYLLCVDNTTNRNSIQLKAGSNMSISAVNGVVTFSATDTNTDTKNTAGSTNTSSKIFLVGATSQAANPQTYSHDTAYVGTDGCLYSNSKIVLNSDNWGTDLTSTDIDAMFQ